MTSIPKKSGRDAITISTSMIAAQVNMTGRFSRPAPCSSHGGSHLCAPPTASEWRKALMANANAANKPRTAPPTTAWPRPISVVNNMGTMWSDRGAGAAEEQRIDDSGLLSARCFGFMLVAGGSPLG